MYTIDCDYSVMRWRKEKIDKSFTLINYGNTTIKIKYDYNEKSYIEIPPEHSFFSDTLMGFNLYIKGKRYSIHKEP